MERENENENGRSRARDRVHSGLEACRLAAQLLVVFLERARRRGRDVGGCGARANRSMRGGVGQWAWRRRVASCARVSFEREESVERGATGVAGLPLGRLFRGVSRARGHFGECFEGARRRRGSGCVWRAPESTCGGGAGGWGVAWRGAWRARSSLVSNRRRRRGGERRGAEHSSRARARARARVGLGLG
jgi:hypothetical protein